MGDRFKVLPDAFDVTRYVDRRFGVMLEYGRAGWADPAHGIPRGWKSQE
jgi:hypothetical protein